MYGSPVPKNIRVLKGLTTGGQMYGHSLVLCVCVTNFRLYEFLFMYICICMLYIVVGLEKSITMKPKSLDKMLLIELSY